MDFDELTKKYAGGGHWLRHAPELRKKEREPHEPQVEEEERKQCERERVKENSTGVKPS